MRKRGLSLLLAVALLLMTAGGAHANSGPPRWTGDKAGALLPGRSSTIHVAQEHLRFAMAESLAETQVTARYLMENRGNQPEQVELIFVIQDWGPGWLQASDPTFTLDGERLTSVPVPSEALPEAAQREMAAAWGAESQVIDPVTGERYDLDPYGGGDGRLLYHQASFPLAAGERKELAVSYYQQAGFHKNRYAHPIYHYQYLLLPAKGWASFGPLEIEVVAPPASKAFFRSTLDFTYRDGAYRASFPTLPEQNLTFAFMSRAGMIGGLVTTGNYFLLAFLLLLPLAVLVGIGLGQLTGRIRSAGWARFVAVLAGLLLGGLIDLALLALLYSLSPVIRGAGYATLFIGVLQLFLLAPISAVAASVAGGRLHRRLYPPAA